MTNERTEAVTISRWRGRIPLVRVGAQELNRNAAELEHILRGRATRARCGSRIEDYVVEDHADHVLQTFKTQREANRLGAQARACPRVRVENH